MGTTTDLHNIQLVLVLKGLGIRSLLDQLNLPEQNKGEMSPKPSVLRFLNSDMMNTHSDLKFEMSNLNYPGIYMHIASDSHFGSL